MKYTLILLSFVLSVSVNAQTIWLEDFTGLPDGTVNDTGLTAWDALGSPTGYFEVRGERIAARNTDNVMTWRSEVIDISTAGLVNISVLLNEAGIHEENQDYIRFYYKVDGGSQTPFAINFNHFRYGKVMAFALYGSHLSGSTLQIIAEVRNTAGDEYMYFDDIQIYQAPPATLYARQNGNWTDPNTWSATPGGVSCNCLPDINTTLYIDGYDVLLNSDQSINNVFLSNNANLNIENASLFIYGDQFTIDATSSMREQIAEAKVIFSGDANATFTNNSSAGVLLDELDMVKNAKLTIEGTGDIYLNNDIDLDVCDSLVFNNTSTITITDDLNISTSDLIIINNSANLVVLDDISQNQWNSNLQISNYNSITCDDFNFSNNKFRLHNYGTITNNDILNVGVDNEIHNYDNATWTYRGEIKDPDIILYASYPNNTFIYGSAGNQQIIEPQSSYYNLEIIGSGTKSTDFIALTVDKDLILRDDVILDVGTFGTNVTVGDDFESFSLQADPFIPGTTTVSIGMGQNYLCEINSLLGIRFYNLEVNTTNEFKVSSKDIIIENNLNMINGPLHASNDGRYVILDNATIIGYNATRFIVGPVKKVGDDSFIFPLGDDGNFRPLEMTAPANTTDAFTAYHRDQAIPGAYDINQNDYIIDNILNCSYYFFSRDAGSSSVQVIYPWNNNCSVPDLKHLTIAGWNGSQWVDEGNGGTTGTITEGTIINDSTLSNYQIVALASRTLQPVAMDDSFNTNEDQPVSGNLLSNDSDPMSFNLSVNTTLVQEPTNGTFTVDAAGAFTYTPNANFNGNDTIQYEICNDASSSKCDTAFVYFSIAAVNDAPVAEDDSYTTNEEVTLNIASTGVLINDSDVDGDPITAVLVGDVSNGTLTLNADGSFEYIPNTDFFGNDSFTYQATDGTANSTTASVAITVNNINDAPIAEDDYYTLPQHFDVNGNVLANDYDIDSYNLGAMIYNNPSFGTAQLMSNGDFHYKPNVDFAGNDQFSYILNDEQGALDTAVVYLSVISNNPPVAIDQNIDIYTPGEINICMEASDPENDLIKLSNINITSGEVNGEVSSVDSIGLCFTYIPEFITNSQSVIEVEMCDSWQCTTASVNINALTDAIVIYQAISPNNDGKNDTWIIDGIENYPDNEVKLFNRYGNLIYSTRAYHNETNNWRGETNSGLVINRANELPAGTYFYTINLGNGSQPRTGYVVLSK